MKLEHKIKFLLIGIILGGITSMFIWDACLSDSEVIKVRYDSIIRKFDTIAVPQPYKVTEYVHTARTDTLFLTDTIYLYDTIRIVEDFKFKRFYSDTIRDDELVAYIDETVQFKRITERDFSYRILRPTEIVKPNTASFYLGADLFLDGVVLNASYFNHKHGMELGYDPINKNIYIGLKYKLFEF